MLLWPARWLLRKILGVVGWSIVLILGLLWGLQWVPFVPVPVVQGFFAGQAPKWSWQSDIPLPLRAALREAERASLRKTAPSLAQRTAEYLFYPQGEVRWGSGIAGALLELLWSEERLLIFYFNSLPYDSDVYGVKAAAERRFGKAVAELTPTEGAELLARRSWPYLSKPLPSWLEPEQRRFLRYLSQNTSAHGSP